MFLVVSPLRRRVSQHLDHATFPVPATSSAADAFPALRSPVCFAPRFMGHVVSTYFSVTFFLTKLPRPHYSARWIFWIIVHSIDFFALLFGEEGDRPAYPSGLPLQPSLNLRVDGADVTIGMLAPTTTPPRPRMSATGLSPVFARPLPTILLLTSRFVMPTTLRISKYGNTGNKEARVRKHRRRGT